jgi:hypothetical protein
MERLAYLDFDLKLERAAQGYRARVLHFPACEASHSLTLPFSDLEVEHFVLRLGQRSRRGRRVAAPELTFIKTFGEQRFNTVSDGEVLSCLRASVTEAVHQLWGLRIHLRMHAAPELRDLSWEYLYNAPLNHFLAPSTATPRMPYLTGGGYRIYWQEGTAVRDRERSRLAALNLATWRQRLRQELVAAGHTVRRHP